MGYSTVTLAATFTPAVPVCSHQMDLHTGMNNAVVRILNIGPASLEIRLQSAAGQPQVMQVRPMHCIVVEPGQWRFPDEREIEARKFLRSITANTIGWNVYRVQRTINPTAFHRLCWEVPFSSTIPTGQSSWPRVLLKPLGPRRWH